MTRLWTFYEIIKFDGLVKNRNSIEYVIPAKAEIQLFRDVLDPGFRRGDAPRDFLQDHRILLTKNIGAAPCGRPHDGQSRPGGRVAPTIKESSLADRVCRNFKFFGCGSAALWIPAPAQLDRQLEPVGDLHLFIDPVAVGLYGLFADVELPGNLLILTPQADEGGNLFLHPGQFLPLLPR
jgi:hypothetical protein